jgi:hypothetical protein
MHFFTVSLTALLSLLLASGKIAAQEPGQHKVTPVREADAICAQCHGNIYWKYLKTPMANASGLATEHVIEGEFQDARTRMVYRVSLEGQSLWLPSGSGSFSPVSRSYFCRASRLLRSSCA